MKIYLVRHGEAKKSAQGGDSTRPISDQGRDEVSRMASFLGRSFRVTRIVHSGFVRANQTALILAETLAPGQVVEESTIPMGPMADVEDLAEGLARVTEDVMVVGHMPFMGRLAAHLITGDADAEICTFETATVACLEGEYDEWTLQWMAGPRLLGMMGIEKGDVN